MIVLDEHLQDVGIATGFERWYPGQVRSITALRPGSVIKDEAIHTRLVATAATAHIRHRQRIRMGKVVRVSTRVVEYYGVDGQVHSLLWTGD